MTLGTYRALEIELGGLVEGHHQRRRMPPSRVHLFSGKRPGASSPISVSVHTHTQIYI